MSSKLWTNSLCFAALFCLAMGLMTSATLIAGFSILLIPVFFSSKVDFKSVPKSFYFLVLFFISGLVSIYLNYENIPNLSKSFKGIKIFLIMIYAYFPLKDFFRNNTNDKKIALFFNIVLFTTTLALIVGIFRSYFHFDLVTFTSTSYHPRVGGFFHYMRYGYLCGFLFFIHTFIFFKKAHFPFKLNYIFYISWFSTLAGVILSQARGSFLIVMVSFILMLTHYNKKLIKYATATFLLFGTLVAYCSLSGNAPFRIFNYNDQSTQTRIGQYQAAYKVFTENIYFGVGPRQFEASSMVIKKLYNIGEISFRGHAHNILLEIMANQGVIGLVLFALFIGTWFFEVLSLRSKWSPLFVIYIITFLIAGQFEVLFDSINSHFFLLMYILSMTHKEQLEIKKNAPLKA
jgi:O-antigen ligase